MHSASKPKDELKLLGILQDRLIAGLRLADIVMIQETNVLIKSFNKRFNRQFCAPPTESEKQWRKGLRELDLDRIISFRSRTVVDNNNNGLSGRTRYEYPPGLKEDPVQERK